MVIDLLSDGHTATGQRGVRVTRVDGRVRGVE